MGTHVRLCNARSLPALALALAVVVVLGTASCTVGGGGSADGGGGANDGAVLDTAKAIEVPIVAEQGGALGFVTDDYALRVTFPLDTLSSDTTLAVTPLTQAPGQDGKTVVAGFDLVEKATGKGPEVTGPVWIEMVVPQELGEGFSLVSYNEDGTYEVLPTRVKSKKGVSSVIGFTTHFSPVGGRDVGKDAADKARDRFDDYNWVVWVRGQASGQNGPIEQTVYLTLRAVNGSGDIAGDYAGDAQIKSTNTGNIGGMEMTSPQEGKGAAKITLTDGDPLASLTPEDPLASLEPDPLAPLTPPDLPSWWGTGSITMSAVSVAGYAEGHMGGYGGSTGVENQSNLPVTLQVTGTQVSMDVSGLPIGKATFKGFVRGEGRK